MKCQEKITRRTATTRNKERAEEKRMHGRQHKQEKILKFQF